MARHREDATKVTMTIDFKNAFNTVSREAFLRACESKMPRLAAWARWCYQKPTNLQYEMDTLESSSGVQQGDAMGPLLFALVIQPMLEQLRGISGLDIVVAYLDDVVVAGSEEAVAAAYNIISSSAATTSLQQP